MPTRHLVSEWPSRSLKAKHADTPTRRIAEADAFSSHVKSICSDSLSHRMAAPHACAPFRGLRCSLGEIDLDEKIWIIPAERMKAKREHAVPLSSQALKILEVMKPISAHREHVFPSRNDPKQAMNSQTANAALKRIGYGGKLVAHGLRSIASTAMNEAGFNADVIEAALAHSDKNEVRRAYNRSTYFLKRKELMEWWGSNVSVNNNGGY